MSLSLPKAFTDVSPVAFSGVDVKLVEGGEDADCTYLPFSFPEGFYGGMKIFSDSVWVGVPESYGGGKCVWEGVVGEGKRGFEDTVEIAEVD